MQILGFQVCTTTTSRIWSKNIRTVSFLVSSNRYIEFPPIKWWSFTDRHQSFKQKHIQIQILEDSKWVPGRFAVIDKLILNLNQNAKKNTHTAFWMRIFGEFYYQKLKFTLRLSSLNQCVCNMTDNLVEKVKEYRCRHTCAFSVLLVYLIGFVFQTGSH